MTARFLPLVLLAACDYNPAWLFPSASDQAPALYELFAEDGGPLVPVEINTSQDAAANTIYAELGATQTAQVGGATFNFFGTGGDVCVFADPEGLTWTEAVSPRLDENSRPWSYPDNLYDDGDIDITAGLSVYYTGSADEIGDFQVRYEDPLGNPVEVSLSLCELESIYGTPRSKAGRGSAEYCNITQTSVGVEYTVVLETWSTPLDDDRLAFGLILADGDCTSLIGNFGAADYDQALECIIIGEAIRPEAQGPWFGQAAVQELVWGAPVAGGTSFLDYENEFCKDPSESRVDQFCLDEANAVIDAGSVCDWFGDGSGDVHCFCGNTDWSPDPGAI